MLYRFRGWSLRNYLIALKLLSSKRAEIFKLFKYELTPFNNIQTSRLTFALDELLLFSRRRQTDNSSVSHSHQSHILIISTLVKTHHSRSRPHHLHTCNTPRHGSTWSWLWTRGRWWPPCARWRGSRWSRTSPGWSGSLTCSSPGWSGSGSELPHCSSYQAACVNSREIIYYLKPFK